MLSDQKSLYNNPHTSVAPCMQVFHLPIQEAAAKLGMGTTQLKKLCRLLNVEKWPYRQLQSLDRIERCIKGHGYSRTALQAVSVRNSVA